MDKWIKTIYAVFLALLGVGILENVANATNAIDFVKINGAYLSRDGTVYKSLVRTSFYEAHRLKPASCVKKQRDLINVGKIFGFDGLESLWLIYQDCAASSLNKDIGKTRLENARLLQKFINFNKEPAPQISQRVSQWNSTIERGVRSEAVRTTIRRFVLDPPQIASKFTYRDMLSQNNLFSDLCNLPYRKNQNGVTATSEVIRIAQCLTGKATSVTDICNKVQQINGEENLSSNSETAVETDFSGMSPQDFKRLGTFCESRTTSGGAGNASNDGFDSFSTDMCVNEEPAKVWETSKVLELTMECYGTGNGSFLTLGGGVLYGTENLDQNITNTLFIFPVGEQQNVAIVLDDTFYHAVHEDSLGEAMQDLANQLEAAGYNVEFSTGEDGSVTMEYERETTTQNPDGTTTTTRESTSVTGNPDGSSTRNSTVENQNSDGSWDWTRENSTSDGSGEVLQFGRDKDGNRTMTQTTVRADGSSTTITQTMDDDGNVQSTTTTNTDAEGNSNTQITTNNPDGSTSTSTGTGSQSPGIEGGYDPHNSACRELTKMGVYAGMGESEFWDQLFDRDNWVDPRKAKPAPDGNGPGQELGEPFCGASGLGDAPSGSKCKSLVLCEEGTFLDENCRCSRHSSGKSIMLGCFTVDCSSGTHPVPVGANQCMCQPDSPSEGDTPPRSGPGPDVFKSPFIFGEGGPFTELLWNRGGRGWQVLNPRSKPGQQTP